ncbi:MAG: hypothetical protein WC718_02060 [Phycisphaerales bacterium]|jgi:hypothetical protein
MKHSTKTQRNRVAPQQLPWGGAGLSKRDRAVVETLALRVRVLSVHQAARTWWTDSSAPLKACQLRLRELAAMGLLDLFDMLAHPELELATPLTVWQPGLDRPDLAAIAHRARARWTRASVSTTLVCATGEGGAKVGGEGGRRPRTSEATHDLHVATTFLVMRRQLPTRARSWRSESLLQHRAQALPKANPAPRDRLPDAMVRDGRSETAIEFVGDYATDKMAEFHEYCRRSNLGYELW